MRLVGGLVSLDGHVQLYTRGKLTCCSINVLLVIFYPLGIHSTALI